MADYRLPFDDSDGSDEELDDFDEEDTGQIDVTDDGELDDFDEETDNIDKCIKKSNALGIQPKRQYLKTLTDDQYNKIIGKDAYGFLYGHEEELIEVLAVGKEVSDDFKTLSAIDVREVYWIIVSNLEYTNWSSRGMVKELMEKFPLLEEYQAERIIRTELTRVINYCKEFIALNGDLGEYNYGWIGPLDYRTTPMCWYLQTGELRDSDVKALEKAGHTPDELPPIPEEGMPLEQLRETCRIVADLFGYDMISDWVMHINCRHTFARGNKRLDVEQIEPSEVDRMVEELIDLAPGGGDEIQGEIIPVVEDDKMYFPVFDDFDSYIFLNSIYGVPTMYDNRDADEVFVFEEMNEKDVASWSRMVIQLREEYLDDETIMWAMADTGNLEEDVLAYIITHANEINARAEHEGWF